MATGLAELSVLAGNRNDWQVSAFNIDCICSIVLNKPVLSSIAILGEISISGTMIKVEELANVLQMCLDSGAKKVLLPSTSFADFATVPADFERLKAGVFYLLKNKEDFKITNGVDVYYVQKNRFVESKKD